MNNRELCQVPNGGFGWWVAFGVAVTNVFNQSLISVFGLLFGEYFEDLMESTSRIALVMNLCSMFLNLSGFITGPVLKQFSARKITIFGSLMTSSGLMMSSITTTLPQIIFTYSFMVGIGLGLIAPASFVAVSSYFTTKRSRAVGFALAGTGLGQMILPLIVQNLLDEYGFRGTILIMGSLALHGVVGGCLYQPVSKHLKRVIGTENQPLVVKQMALDIEDEKPLRNRIWNRLSNAMDLTLLKDFTFLSINFGLAFAYAASVNFAMILPFFLQQTANLNKSQTAFCMSILAATDLFSRLTHSFITNKLKMSSRTTFLVGILSLGITRSVLAESRTYNSLIVICAIYGYARALIVVNMTLTISEYCTKNCPEKLPGALGLNMIIKGFCVLTLGQLLGYVSDLTSSYSISLHSQNILLVIVFIVWTVELIWYKK